MAAATCLPRETLKQYLVGDVEESQTEAIESHLASCPECEQTVVELEANPDTLMVGIRALPAQQGKHDQQGKQDQQGYGQERWSSATKAGEEPSVVQQALAAVRQLPEISPKHLSEWPVGQIGAYELLRPLGRGGMGMVVLARHRSLQKEVAIKLLSSLLGDKPELVSRFQREMRAAGRLQHPAIVNATDAGQERGTHYLVMEYVAGLDLSRIARLVGRLSIADACELTRQTALGLSHAHAEGIVHRDVKPSNLMLDATGHVKILDFGLAQINLWDEPVCELTTVGQLMGTIDYMAPEQAERIGAVDYRADLYALGATLFRLLAGRAPLAASPNMTLLEKVRLLGSQTSPLLSSVREDCPPELVQLVSQLLSRDPAARPASAAHVAQSLEPFCSGNKLVELLANAQAAAVADPIADPAVESAMPSLAQPSSLQFAETVGSSRTPTKPPIRRWLWTAAAALPLMILAGILITIETQKGQLVIQSDVADVQIKVARDGKVVDELTVQPGAQSTRLRADKYEILIDSPSDQVVVDKQQFSIKSGETVVATIKQVERGLASLPSFESKLTPNANELTYEGTTYSQWLRKLATDVSDEKQNESLMALYSIGERRQIEDARPVVLQVLKGKNYRQVFGTQFIGNAFGVLSKTFASEELYHQFIASEVRSGNEDWQSLILESHWCFDPAMPLIDVAKDLVSRADLGRPKTSEAAGDYLFNCVCKFAATGNDVSVSALLDVLERSPGLTMSFWWKKLDNESSDQTYTESIRGAFARVASRALTNKISADEGVRALQIIDRCGDPTNLDWLVPFVSQLVDNPERISRFCKHQGDTFPRKFIEKVEVDNDSLEVPNGEAIDALRLALQGELNSEKQAAIRRLLEATTSTVPDAKEWINMDNNNRFIQMKFRHYRVRTEHAWNRLTETQRGLVIVATAASSLLPEFNNDFNFKIDFPDSIQVGQRAMAFITIRSNSTVGLPRMEVEINNDPGLKAIAADSSNQPQLRQEDGRVFWSYEGGDAVRKLAIVFEAVAASDKATIHMKAASGDKVLGEATTSTAIVASQKETGSDVDVPGRSSRSGSEQITFNQIPYEEWLHILSTDLSDEKISEAFKAIIAISAKRNIADARPVIVEVLKSLSKQSPTPLAQIALQALYMSFDQDEAKYNEYLAQMLRTGSADEQRLIFVNIAGNKVQRESMGDVIVKQAIRIAMDTTSDQALAEIACDYLCYVWCNKAPRSTSLEGKTLDGITQQICDTLLNCPQLTWEFWAGWEGKTTSKMKSDEVRMQLAEFFVRAAERVAKNEMSTPEDCIVALKVFSTYKNRMQDTDWIEPYIERVLTDPKRQTALYESVWGNKHSPTMDSLSQSSYMVSQPMSTVLADSMRGVGANTFSVRENELLVILSAIRNQKLIIEKQHSIRRILEAAQSQLPGSRGQTDALVRLRNGDSVTFRPQDSVWQNLDDRQRVLSFIAAYAKELLDSPEGRTGSASTKESTNKQPDPEEFIAALRGSPPKKSEGKDVLNTVPTEPLFDGRTLSQWLEMLERDRDLTARSTAMKAIGKLADKTESSQVTARLMAIARQSNSLQEWSDYTRVVDLVKYGGRTPARATLDRSLIDLLIQLNGKEWFQEFLATDLLKGDDTWTARWLAALLNGGESEHTSVIYDSFKEKAVFDALGPNSAWLAQVWLAEHLGSNETNAKESAAHVLALIEGQPHLGQLAVLQVDAEIRTRFRPKSSNSSNTLDPNQNPAQLLVDEAVAKYAKTVLESDEASPEAVARAASRLASTTEIVQDWKAELLEVIRKRLGALAKDRDRLTAILPVDQQREARAFYRFPQRTPTDRPWKLPIPVTNRFATIPRSGITMSSDGVQRSVSISEFRSIGMVPPYVESECVALIALMVRLEGASQCEEQLTLIAEATWPDFDSLMTQTGSRTLTDPDQGNGQTEPWLKISNATWLGWAIHRELYVLFIQEKERLPQLSPVLNRTLSRLYFLQADQNSDGKLSSEELRTPEANLVDANKDGSLDFEEFRALSKQDQEAPKNVKITSEGMDWAKRQFARYDLNGDGKLNASESSKMLVAPVGADSNGDGEITVEEFLRFRQRK